MRDHYEEIIEAEARGWGFEWQELIRYRDLIFILSGRDFYSKYQRTVLGPLWVVLQPLLTTLVFAIVFGRLARVSTDGVASVLFYFSGLLTWNYFSRCLADTARTYLGSGGLFARVYFPRLIVPIASVLFHLLELAIQALVFAGIYLYFKGFTEHGPNLRPNLLLAALPLVILQVAALGTGAGLWLAALSTRLRDVQYVFAFVTQTWFFLSPVIYPLSATSEAWRWVMLFNPMASAIETVRCAWFGIGFVQPAHTLMSAVITLLIFASGLAAFKKAEYHFVDTL